MDIYAHFFPSGNKEWSAKLDDVQIPVAHPRRTLKVQGLAIER